MGDLYLYREQRINVLLDLVNAGAQDLQERGVAVIAITGRIVRTMRSCTMRGLPLH
jgi:hypothetical protein